DLRELEYASLLHDFGKIGVREEVLLKAKKLFPHQLEIIRTRFEFAVRSLELDIAQRKLRVHEKGGKESELEALDRQYVERRQQLDDAFATISVANEPTVLKGGAFEKLEAIARETYTDLYGNVCSL